MVKHNHAVLLNSMEIEDQWQEADASSTFGDSPEVKWFVEYTVELEYAKKDVLRKMWRGNNKVDLGYISLVVCSPALAKEPVNFVAKKLNSALIQSHFDDQSTREYVKTKLAEIPSALSTQELKSKLKEFLSIS
jgi:hypothetical protein